MTVNNCIHLMMEVQETMKSLNEFEAEQGRLLDKVTLCDLRSSRTCLEHLAVRIGNMQVNVSKTDDE